MYRVKTNGKYILVVKDLGMTISHDSPNGVLISDEDFKKSMDIKKIERYLIIEKINDAEKVSTAKVAKANVAEKNTFILHEENGDFNKIPDGMQVADPNNEMVHEEVIAQPNETVDIKESVGEIKSEENVNKENANKVVDEKETSKNTKRVKKNKETK